MADYTAIYEVGNTLIKLFQEQIEPDLIPNTEGSIVMASPASVADSQVVRLSLFLYEIKQNATVSQQTMIDNGSNTLRYPPMAVDLHYLLTAHSPSPDQDISRKTLSEHTIMGRAIQVLHDHAVIRNSLLCGSLADYNEELRVYLMEPMPMNLLGVMFPNISYKLSYPFIVGPVYLNSRRSTETARVFTREADTRQLSEPLPGGEA